ncbi:MAG: hypothetical protein Q8L79_01520 [Methylobacter sp.]|uniref:hypothetical protein n=1 Tax=Methylobacter sp. TaxID=2051955 RepID=UPI002731F179|nr:hypothetical protein [Methylobacter sp.]MDP1663777.1 hypothetical protein [Methylobacter sp.]
MLRTLPKIIIFPAAKKEIVVGQKLSAISENRLLKTNNLRFSLGVLLDYDLMAGRYAGAG